MKKPAGGWLIGLIQFDLTVFSLSLFFEVMWVVALASP